MRSWPRVCALLAAAAVLRAEAARAEPAVAVLCERGGRVVLQSTENCLLQGGHPRERTAGQRPGEVSPPGWARWEGRRGTALRRVLGCRERWTLRRIAASESATALAVRSGACLAISPQTGFELEERATEAVRISTPADGSLWVSSAGDPAPASAPDVRDAAPGAAEEGQVPPGDAAEPAVTATPAGESCPAPPPGQPASAFASVQIVDWQPVLGGERSAHPQGDGLGRDRCARIHVCYQGSGSRLVDASDFDATFASGEVRRGAHFSGGSVRLSDRQSARGLVCFGGALQNDIVSVRMH